MSRRTAILIGLLALPVGALAFALLIGAGVLRQGSALMVSAGAVALLVLPAAGLAQLLRLRAEGTLLALPVWSVAVLLVFPLYFPGERSEALAAGLGVALPVFGVSPDPAWALAIDGLLPSLGSARPRPARASAPEVALPPPPLRTLDLEALAGSGGDQDEVVLPYEGTGRTLSVPVVLEGPGGRSAEVWMLYDTGATLTSIDTATLASIGVRVPSDAPEIRVRTAAGERTTKVVILERVWVGGMEVTSPTASVCDECAGDDTVGLLGLNVSGHFLVTTDHARQELILRPRVDARSSTLDVSPWVETSATATRWDDGRIEVEARIVNRADRVVRRAEVAIVCDETWMASLVNVPPLGTASTVVALPVGADCEGYSVRLEEASW